MTKRQITMEGSNHTETETIGKVGEVQITTVK